GAPGVAMLTGLVAYLSGRRGLPAEAGRKGRAKGTAPAHPPLVKGDGARVTMLVLLLPLLVLSALGNQEIFNAYLVWGDANFDLSLFGMRVEVTDLVSVDAFISTATIFLSLIFWRWWAKRRTEPNEITKLTIGTLI